MRKCRLIIVLSLSFLVEAAALAVFACRSREDPQDTVMVNEALQAVQEDWGALEGHDNGTDLDYVVLDAEGAVVYRTRPGLSESINAAVGHRDTVLDVRVHGAAVGKMILYNDAPKRMQSEKRGVLFVTAAAILAQWGICIAYLFYIHRTVTGPFGKLKKFAERVAEGNLDIPLVMDRRNIFGAFTESFDLMRSELKKAKIAEAKANAARKELVAKLSHDIKTPVASIKAASEVGAALAEDEKTREHYGRILQKADQINTLVTNLFSVTLEELHELSVEPVDMESRELAYLLENADYLHRAVIPGIPDCLLWADRLRLQQVFDNIFANSYKYANTPIEVSLFRESGCLVVCIQDYGGGIAAEELPFLKEKFKRGSNAKNVEGAGLGLYISDHCMKGMQGRLDLENGPRGLKVSVRIALSGTI